MTQSRQPWRKVGPDEGDGLATLIGELRDLVIAYARQQTLDPLKQLGRYVGYGLAGGLLLTLGSALLSLGLLRALQAETGSHLEGNLSWLPYVVVVVLLVALAGLMVRQISRTSTGKES